MKALITSLILLPLLLASACSPKSSNAAAEDKNFETVQPLEKGYSIIFYFIDDFAHIYADDSLVFKTNGYYRRSEGELMVRLDTLITDQTKNIRIELHNRVGLNPWEISYEIFLNGESFDYYSASSNNVASPSGLVDSEEFELER